MSPLRALLIAIELVAVTCAYPQTSVLNRDVPAIPSGQYSLTSLLMKVGLATRVPMGIELAGSEGRPEFYPGNEQGISLQDFLTATIKTDGPYVWKQSGDVINVFPKRAIRRVQHGSRRLPCSRCASNRNRAITVKAAQGCAKASTATYYRRNVGDWRSVSKPMFDIHP